MSTLCHFFRVGTGRYGWYSTITITKYSYLRREFPAKAACTMLFSGRLFIAKLWLLDQQKTFTGTFFSIILPSFSEVVFPAEQAGTIGFSVTLIVIP